MGACGSAHLTELKSLATGDRELCELHEASCEGGASCVVLVFEEDVGVRPAECFDAIPPGLELFIGVVLTAKADVAPGRGRHEWRGRVVGVRDAQRDVARPKRIVDLVLIPGFVTELEGCSYSMGQLGEEVCQQRDILLEV